MNSYGSFRRLPSNSAAEHSLTQDAPRGQIRHLKECTLPLINMSIFWQQNFLSDTGLAIKFALSQGLLSIDLWQQSKVNEWNVVIGS